MKSKIYLPSLYVERTPIVIDRLREIGNKELLFFSRAKRLINLDYLELNSSEKWDFLDGLYLRGRSGKSLKFKKEITPDIAQLLGFICTDGSILSTEATVCLCQKDKKTIIPYFDVINEEFSTNLSLGFNGKEARLRSNPLRYVLHFYYGLFLGNKIRTVEVPKQIYNSNDEKILSRFIAGVFDGDGYSQTYYLKNGFLDHMNFCISMNSHIFVKQCRNILEKLRIKSHLFKRKDGRLTLQTSGFENSILFYNKIISYLHNLKRKNKCEKVIISKDFVGKLTVKLNNDIKNLFRELRTKKKDKELLEKLNFYPYVNSLGTIESWTYKSYFGKIRMVYVYFACKLLNKNPYLYIPKEHISLLENVYRKDKTTIVENRKRR